MFQAFNTSNPLKNLYAKVKNYFPDRLLSSSKMHGPQITCMSPSCEENGMGFGHGKVDLSQSCKNSSTGSSSPSRILHEYCESCSTLEYVNEALRLSIDSGKNDKKPYNFSRQHINRAKRFFKHPEKSTAKEAKTWAEVIDSSDTSESSFTEESPADTLTSDLSDVSDQEDMQRERSSSPNRCVRAPKSAKRVRFGLIEHFNIPDEHPSPIRQTVTFEQDKITRPGSASSCPRINERTSLYIAPFQVYDDHFPAPPRPTEDESPIDLVSRCKGLKNFEIEEDYFPKDIADPAPLSDFILYEDFFGYSRDFRASCYADYLSYHFPQDEVLCETIMKRDRFGFADQEWDAIWRSGQSWKQALQV